MNWGAFASNLAASAGAALAVMLATFAIALRLGIHRIVDIAWGIAFAAVALVTWVLSAGYGDDLRRLLVLAATCLWGLRLALHIARRARGHGEDPRYAAMLARAPGSPARYALRKVYLLQGALVWLVSLPVQAAAYLPGGPDPLMVLGLALWAAGLGFEAVGGPPARDVQVRPRQPGPDHGPGPVGLDQTPQLLRRLPRLVGPVPDGVYDLADSGPHPRLAPDHDGAARLGQRQAAPGSPYGRPPRLRRLQGPYERIPAPAPPRRTTLPRAAR
ncbi:hypothetical protein GCM10020254_07070 [Streptomyces goshikiensis]